MSRTLLQHFSPCVSAPTPQLPAARSTYQRRAPAFAPTCCSTAPVGRLCALECVDGLRLLPYATVFPLRKQVADKLKPVLADRKRRVRVAAAGVRGRWFESAGAGAA